MRKWSWAMCCLIAACNGTSTGNPLAGDTKGTHGGTPNSGEDIYGSCAETKHALASLDAQTPLGFSAADVLAFAEGEHTTAIRWQSGATVELAPEHGEHMLTLAVTRSGEPRYTTYKEQTAGPTVPDGSKGGHSTAILDIAGPSCASMNAVEVDVAVTLKSDAGALDESLTGTLRATSKLWATIDLGIDPKKLGGSFTAKVPEAPSIALTQLALQLGFSPYGLHGSLTGTLESPPVMTGPNSGSAGGVTSAATGGALAYIGAAGCDPMPYGPQAAELPVSPDLRVLDFTANDAFALLEQAASIEGTWRDGSSASFGLSFDHAGAAICAQLAPSLDVIPDATVAGTLQIHGRLKLASSDHRLDADWPALASAVPDSEGRLAQVSLAIESGHLESPGPSNLASVYGFKALQASGYDSYQLVFALQLMAGDPAPSASGMLELDGLTFAACVKEPPAPTPGASSSPGCKGADFTPIESITW